MNKNTIKRANRNDIMFSIYIPNKMSCNVTPSNIEQCEQSIQFLSQAIAEDNRKYQDYVNAQQNYNAAITSWTTAHEDQKLRLEQGKTAPGGYIWHNGSLVNCNSVEQCGAGGIRDCGRDRNCTMIQQKCTACIDKKCNCMSGASEYCGTCKNEYRYNTRSAYQDQYDAWIRNNPKPTAPAVYTRQTNYPNILCQACTQCVEFSNINANNVKASDINQAQQCVANMRDQTGQPSPAPSPAPTPAPVPATPPQFFGLNQTQILLIIGMIFIFFILIAVLIATAVSSGGEAVNHL